MMNKTNLNKLTDEVIGAAIEVHKFLGPGLMESTYHRCMERELTLRGISYESQLVTDLAYKGEKLSADLRCDLFIEKQLVVELKSIEAMAPVHHAQVITYMRLLNVPKGVLINFNCDNIFKSGQKTFVNNLFAALPD